MTPEAYKNKYSRLEDFLKSRLPDVLDTKMGGHHDYIINGMLSHMVTKWPFKHGSTALDIGCGDGHALKLMSRSGFSVVGITLNQNDLEPLEKEGYEVYIMDQSFLKFPDDSFDLVWSRHCLEHSIMPYFTLQEMRRVSKPGGIIYIELPANDSRAVHEVNINHYSIHTKTMWVELFNRIGLKVLDHFEINIDGIKILDLVAHEDIDKDVDMFWSFFLRNPEEEPNEQTT